MGIYRLNNPPYTLITKNVSIVLLLILTYDKKEM